jgi:hypothetical protein
MLRTSARLVLFVSSYAPLLALFAILDSFGRGWPSIACGVLACASVAGLTIIWRVSIGGQRDWLHVRQSHNRDADVMAYFVSYIIPFAAVDSPNFRTRVALGVFAVIVAALYLRASDFYIHPLLSLVGFHVFDATTTADIPVTVVTRRRFLPQDDVLWVVPMSPSVYLERGRNDQQKAFEEYS